MWVFAVEFGVKVSGFKGLPVMSESADHTA